MEDNKRNLIYYLSGRILIISIIVFITLFYAAHEKTHPSKTYVLLALEVIILLTSIPSLIWIARLEESPSFQRMAIWQVIFDILFFTVAAYYTGLVESPFIILFFYSIIFSPFFLRRRQVFYITLFSIVSFGAVVNLALYRAIPALSPTSLNPGYVVPRLVSFLSSFVIVAFLSSLLADQQRKTRQELYRTEVSIRDYLSFFRELLDTIPSGVLVVAQTGYLLFSNKNAERILQRKLAPGVNLSLLYPEFFSKISHAEELKRAEISITTENGTKILGFSATRTEVQKVPAIVMVLQDLTDVKNMEERMKLKEWSAKLGEFAGSLAHEIRNPLSAVKGTIEFIRDKKTDDEVVSGLLKKASEEVKRIENLVNDFLLFAKVPGKKENVKVKRFISTLIEDFKAHQNAVITFKAEGEVVAPVYPVHLSHAVMNLVHNAVKFSRGRPVQINLKRDDKFAIIEVIDEGPGVPEREREKIFFPFYASGEMGGTGLGLAIVRRVAELHGGKVELAGRKDAGGSIFRLKIPLEEG